jgi:hypothetical protein
VATKQRPAVPPARRGSSQLAVPERNRGVRKGSGRRNQTGNNTEGLPKVVWGITGPRAGSFSGWVSGVAIVSWKVRFDNKLEISFRAEHPGGTDEGQLGDFDIRHASRT